MKNDGQKAVRVDLAPEFQKALGALGPNPSEHHGQQPGLAISIVPMR